MALVAGSVVLRLPCFAFIEPQNGLDISPEVTDRRHGSDVLAAL